jgi:hypothetical protein
MCGRYWLTRGTGRFRVISFLQLWVMEIEAMIDCDITFLRSES